MLTLPERITSKIKPVDSGCWLWMGTCQKNGYGYTRWKNAGRWGHARTHRLAYEAAYGPIAEGLEIDHMCAVRGCMNPAHLRAVTHAENLLTRRPRPKTGKPRCLRGHLYADTDFDRHGRRWCSECRRIRDRATPRRRGGLSHR